MRFRLVTLITLLVPSVLVGQSASTVTQDPQAISVLNQALTASGGAQALKAVLDYKASGNISYHYGSDVQGTVTIMGLNTTEFRLDANLPAGIRSWSINQGITTTKDENGRLSRRDPRTSPYPYKTPLFPSSIAFPYIQLVAVLNNPIYKISYIGVEQLDGRSVHHIELQRVLPQQVRGNDLFHRRDIFIDASTLQLAMTQDIVGKSLVHQVRYGAYTSVGGILVPFSISEHVSGQATWSIQLSQMTFNNGLQEPAFALQ
jgi:hypothetical protein